MASFIIFCMLLRLASAKPSLDDMRLDSMEVSGEDPKSEDASINENMFSDHQTTESPESSGDWGMYEDDHLDEEGMTVDYYQSFMVAEMADILMDSPLELEEDPVHGRFLCVKCLKKYVFCKKVCKGLVKLSGYVTDLVPCGTTCLQRFSACCVVTRKIKEVIDYTRFEQGHRGGHGGHRGGHGGHRGGHGLHQQGFGQELGVEGFGHGIRKVSPHTYTTTVIKTVEVSSTVDSVTTKVTEESLSLISQSHMYKESYSSKLPDHSITVTTVTETPTWTETTTQTDTTTWTEISTWPDTTTQTDTTTWTEISTWPDTTTQTDTTTWTEISTWPDTTTQTDTTTWTETSTWTDTTIQTETTVPYWK